MQEYLNSLPTTLMLRRLLKFNGGKRRCLSNQLVLLFAPSITVERFKADGFRYEVTENYQIVHFQPISDDNFHNFPSYKMDRELYKPKAIALILHLDPGAVLEQLVFQANVDDGYFDGKIIQRTNFQTDNILAFR